MEIFRRIICMAAIMASPCAASVAIAANEYDADLEIKIWDNGNAPHSNGETEEEYIPLAGRVANISEAVLYVYKADKALNTGRAVVICPGGGYGRLAIVHEGQEIAQWFAQNGITAAVLKYRMPKGIKEVPFEDAQEALRIMRERAKKLGFDPSKVGIAGCSAGGHLAASISVLSDKELRPDFSILFYPVISGETSSAHKGSFNNLLGTDRDEALTDKYSLEKQVDGDTPPAILLLSDDDKSVSPVNSTLYYNALKRHGINSALYIFPEGGHGWGFLDSFKYKSMWQELLLDWISKLDK